MLFSSIRTIYDANDIILKDNKYDQIIDIRITKHEIFFFLPFCLILMVWWCIKRGDMTRERDVMREAAIARIVVWARGTKGVNCNQLGIWGERVEAQADDIIMYHPVWEHKSEQIITCSKLMAPLEKL